MSAVRRAGRWAPLAVGGLMLSFASTFIVLSLIRHRGFFTARFDLGNVTQAVRSASHGELFTVTDPAGAQMSRLGAHVEPILGVFAPLWRLWPSPEMLLVVQALVVATIAVPAFLLARRWLADDRLAVTFAAVALLYPALQWATLFDFHPVTLAAPLILWCIWAAVEGRYLTLGILAALAALTKEQVGFSLALLGLWMAVSLGRRRAGAILAGASLAWTAVAVWVIIPHYNRGTASPFLDRYSDLGSSTGDVIRTLVTRPWEAAEIVATADRGKYLLALLLPLLMLSPLAPLLAAGALPDLVLNLLSSRPEQFHIEYHYGTVIAPFLLAAAIRGLATVRTKGHPARLRALAMSPAPVAVAVAGAVVAGGYVLGPLPFWEHVPGGSRVKVEQYSIPDRAKLLSDAVALVPHEAVVSAGNRIGGHLSARPRILTFPTIADADYVVVDELRPDVEDDVDPARHAAEVKTLRGGRDFALVSERDGVLVFTRGARRR